MATPERVLNDRYRLLEQRAAGGMAVVYKAQDLSLGRTVAIKILRPSLTNDQTFLVRFRQEARNVANLSHPNIVTVYDFGQDGSTYYIVMEYVEGQDLKKLIKSDAPFPIDRMLNLAIQMCAGIGYAHRAGLVHADVKPQNILVTAADHVKVTDFGIAQVLSETQPRERQSIVWGSPHYFAPEQAAGDAPTPAADVYALGIVFFEMLTGKLPYNGMDQQTLALAHMREPVPHVMDFNPQVPVHLDRIVYKVMAKNPNDRYATADQLGRILIGYKQQGSDQTLNQPQLPVAGSPNPQPPMIPVSPVQLSPLRPQPGQPIPPAPAVPAPNYAPQGGAPAYNYPPPANSTQPATYQPPMYPPPNAYAPSSGYAGNPPGVMGQGYQPPSAPAPNYQAPLPHYSPGAAPPVFDLVTIALGVIAALAVLGLFPLWLAVLSAYSR
ncbi:MAG: protein kinase domain-containing protein [Aggregatilineales bacterium]